MEANPDPKHDNQKGFESQCSGSTPHWYINWAKFFFRLRWFLFLNTYSCNCQWLGLPTILINQSWNVFAIFYQSSHIRTVCTVRCSLFSQNDHRHEQCLEVFNKDRNYNSLGFENCFFLITICKLKNQKPKFSQQVVINCNQKRLWILLLLTGFYSLYSCRGLQLGWS